METVPVLTDPNDDTADNNHQAIYIAIKNEDSPAEVETADKSNEDVEEQDMTRYHSITNKKIKFVDFMFTLVTTICDSAST